MQVAYYDAALPDVQARYASAIEAARQRYWPYPLVLLDGQIVLAGDVNVYRLTRLIRDELVTD